MMSESYDQVRATTIDGWESGWLWVGAYDPAPGFAVLRTGPVGDVVACVTVQTWDGFAEAFYLRWDPARVCVDLLAKIDLDTPWSIESTHALSPEMGEAIEEAADDYDPDPSLLFELLITANPDLEISQISAELILDIDDAEETFIATPERSRRWLGRSDEL